MNRFFRCWTIAATAILLLGLTAPVNSAPDRQNTRSPWQKQFHRQVMKANGLVIGVEKALNQALTHNKVPPGDVIDYMLRLDYPPLFVAFSMFQQAKNQYGPTMIDDEAHRAVRLRLENALARAGIERQTIETAKYMIEAELVMMIDRGIIKMPVEPELPAGQPLAEEETTGLGYGDNAALGGGGALGQVNFNTGGKKTYASPATP